MFVYLDYGPKSIFLRLRGNWDKGVSRAVHVRSINPKLLLI